MKQLISPLTISFHVLIQMAQSDGTMGGETRYGLSYSDNSITSQPKPFQMPDLSSHTLAHDELPISAVRRIKLYMQRINAQEEVTRALQEQRDAMYIELLGQKAENEKLRKINELNWLFVGVSKQQAAQIVEQRKIIDSLLALTEEQKKQIEEQNKKQANDRNTMLEFVSRALESEINQITTNKSRCKGEIAERLARIVAAVKKFATTKDHI